MLMRPRCPHDARCFCVRRQRAARDHERRTGTLSETGSGDGEGATINVPLTAQAGDACARAVLEEVVWPAALRFQPDILVVSAGYDAHFRDPLAGLSFGTSTFHHLVGECKAMANQLCGGRMVVVLEVTHRRMTTP